MKNKQNKTVFIRITLLISALALGILVVAALTYTGDKSVGPLNDLLSGIGDQVSSIENQIVSQVREEVRSDKMKWFDDYRNNLKKMRNPKQVFWGAYDNKMHESFKNLFALEDSLHTNFPLMHFYTAWGSKSEQQFPWKESKAIYDLGSMPVITWEPWLVDFKEKDYPQMPSVEERDKNCLAAIARGEYDNYINKWAIQVKKYGAPLFLRFAHEMNDPYRYPWGPQNNTAEDFILAWKHVVDRFRVEGAENVLWIWSPHPAYGFFADYYPGEDYVDWIGIPVLNYGTAATWSQWWSFEEIFGNFYDDLSQFNKPIIISEFASLSVGGNRAKWFSDGLADMPVKYPLIKGILFFHTSNDQTTTYKSLDWQITDDPEAIDAIIKARDAWGKLSETP